MVALAAAAVVEDRLAAVLVADPREAGRDLGDRRVPVDLLVAAVRRGGAAARSGGADRSGSGRGASPCCRCSPASRGAPCRRGSCSACAPRAGPRSRSCTRRGCRRSAASRSASCGSPVGQLGQSSSARSWRWTVSSGSASRRARAMTSAPSIEAIDHHRRALRRASACDPVRDEALREDLPPAARTRRRLARADRTRAHRPRPRPRRPGSRPGSRCARAGRGSRRAASRGRSTALLARSIRAGDELARVVGRLAQQLCPAAGEVVVDRPARRAAVREHVVDARRPRASLAHEQRR